MKDQQPASSASGDAPTSVASGVAALPSAIPSVSSATVPLGLVVIAVLVLGNLRGVKAVGALVAAPLSLGSHPQFTAVPSRSQTGWRVIRSSDP